MSTTIQELAQRGIVWICKCGVICSGPNFGNGPRIQHEEWHRQSDAQRAG